MVVSIKQCLLRRKVFTPGGNPLLSSSFQRELLSCRAAASCAGRGDPWVGGRRAGPGRALQAFRPREGAGWPETPSRQATALTYRVSLSQERVEAGTTVFLKRLFLKRSQVTDFFCSDSPQGCRVQAPTAHRTTGWWGRRAGGGAWKDEST